nr:NFX1-type zinc finger-containing protein 1-like isoform X1 [Onthophagus taurus]
MDGDWRNRNIRAKGMGDVRNRVGPCRGVNQGLNVNAQGPNILRAPNAGPSHHAFRFPQQTEKDPFDSDDDEPPTSHRSSRPSTSRPTTPSASIHHLSSLLHRTNLNSSRGYVSQNSSTSSLPSLFSDRIQPNIRGTNSQHPNQRENRFGQQSVGSNRENGHNFPFGGRQRNSHHLNKGGNHGRGGKQNTRMGREDLNASSSSIPSLFNDDQNLPSGNRGKRGPRGRYDRRNDGGDGQRRENENSEGKRPFKRKFPLGFKKLEEVLAGEIPENVLTFLNENFDGLLLLLQEPDLSPDYISLILRSVVKIAESYFEPLKVKILHEVIEDNFIKQLINFLTQLHLAEERDKRRAKYFWSNPNEFFSHLNIFCETVIKMIPSEGKAVLPKLIKAAIFVIPYLNLSADILEQYEELQIFVLNEIEKFHKKHEKLIVKKDQNDPEPPEDFREIPVYPEAIEITTPLKPFLRKNIVEGGYKSVEHYLDVQFRLVRNDFVKPLRDGILAYLDPENTKRPQNIKVYNGVKFLKSEICANSADSYLIQLPQPKKVQLKLENSRLFMFGSLVCFTKDYFKTLIFGRIADRKIELLKASQLVVSLHFNTELVDFEGEYLMIESKVYFEPYYHVLTALQQLDEDDFPMKEYIVDTKVDDGVPEYYLENTIQTPGKYKMFKANTYCNPLSVILYSC